MSTQPAHTPGPWKMCDELFTTCGVETCEPIIPNMPEPFGFKIAHIYPAGLTRMDSGPDAMIERARANARLIAAAPELLAALKVIAEVSRLDVNLSTGEKRYYITADEISAARQAIAKAEART